MSITSAPAHNRMRLLAASAMAFAALGLGAGPVELAAIASAQYNADWYDWCMNHLEEGSDYCCEHSGGVVRGGACINPDDLRAPLENIDLGPSGPVIHPTRPEVIKPATRATWTFVG